MEDKDKKPFGRPTKYDPEMIDLINSYLLKCLEANPKELISIEGIAYILDVDDETVVIWENATYPEAPEDAPEDIKKLAGQLKYPDFSATIKKARMLQKRQLMQDGLYGGKEVNTAMAIFLLKANHNMVETVFADITSKGEKIGNTSSELLELYRQVMKKDGDVDSKPDSGN